MPPKKQPDKKKKPDGEPVGYKTEVMDLNQLRGYARLLEAEIEEMRKHCNFYQKAEDEVVEFVGNTEDSLRHYENKILEKDFELEKMKFDLRQYLQQKGQWPKYMEHVNTEKRENLSTVTCAHEEDEENRHLEETGRLNAILREKGRQLETLRASVEMARKETQEKDEKFLKDTDEYRENLLRQSIKKFDDMTHETEKDFQLAMEAIKSRALEGKIMGERTFNEACQGFVRKLQEYYKEVTRQDLNAVKDLRNEIKKIEGNIASSKQLLQKAYQENSQLKQNSRFKLARRDNSQTAPKFDAGPLKMLEALKMHNKTEKFVLENQNLEEEINRVSGQTLNLKKQFVSALKKVRENAQRKTDILEGKLTCISDAKRSELVSVRSEGSATSVGESSADSSGSLPSSDAIE